MTNLPSVRNGTQHCEKQRKNVVSNYESPALTAELQARRALTREHPTANVQRPIVTEATQVFSKLCPSALGNPSLTILAKPGGIWVGSQLSVRERRTSRVVGALAFCPCDHGLRVGTNSRFEFISRCGPTAFRRRSLSSVIEPC
jgi:hypothetical protein